MLFAGLEEEGGSFTVAEFAEINNGQQGKKRRDYKFNLTAYSIKQLAH